MICYPYDDLSSLGGELPFILYSHAISAKFAKAQSVEHLAVNQEVGGSIPPRAIFNFFCTVMSYLQSASTRQKFILQKRAFMIDLQIL